MRILLVEDDLEGAAGLQTAASGAFDIIVLDMMLPSRMVWTSRPVSWKGIAIPVVLLTARDGVDDIVRPGCRG